MNHRVVWWLVALQLAIGATILEAVGATRPYPNALPVAFFAFMAALEAWLGRKR